MDITEVLMEERMDFRILNNGSFIPSIGYGTYKTGSEGETEQAVANALSVGYRLLDTAAYYGNEEAVGRGIKASGVNRTDIIITTKIWHTDAGYDNTMRAVESSLKKLDTNYIDIMLVHQPLGDYYGSWRAMEELYDEGLIKAIGVSNFAPDRLTDLATFNRITPAVNQIEMHPFLQQGQNVEFMQSMNVQAQSWASFAEGKNNLFSNPLLASIAQVYNKSVAQVVLRRLIQRNVIVIPKSVNLPRIRENFNVFDFSISDADMEKISQLDTGETLFTAHTDPERIKTVGTKIFNT